MKTRKKILIITLEIFIFWVIPYFNLVLFSWFLDEHWLVTIFGTSSLAGIFFQKLYMELWESPESMFVSRTLTNRMLLGVMIWFICIGAARSILLCSFLDENGVEFEKALETMYLIAIGVLCLANWFVGLVWHQKSRIYDVDLFKSNLRRQVGRTAAE